MEIFLAFGHGVAQSAQGIDAEGASCDDDGDRPQNSVGIVNQIFKAHLIANQQKHDGVDKKGQKLPKFRHDQPGTRVHADAGAKIA